MRAFCQRVKVQRAMGLVLMLEAVWVLDFDFQFSF